jgi:hypothetical protein
MSKTQAQKTELTIDAPTARAMAYFALGVIRGVAFASPDGVAELDDEWVEFDDRHVINLWFSETDDIELSAAVYPIRDGIIDGSVWVTLDIDAARRGAL